MVVTTRITHKYLMNKTKWDLASWLMDDLDRIDNLTAQLESARAELAALREALEEIHRLPLAPETRADMPYSLLANIDHIAKEALGIQPAAPEVEP